jgi:glycine/D-amino acid oxidase-like deaminating enzyme
VHRRRIAIVGAGPIGLEAALHAVEAGYRVSVFERGRVAGNMRDWGHVRLFSPFGMNCSPRGLACLGASRGGAALPQRDTLLTGHEFVEC